VSESMKDAIPTFSVIIPTSGRKSLRRTLRRLRSEAEGDIEVIVVSDGDQPTARAIANQEADRWAAIRYLDGPLTGNWGNAQRMVGIKEATGRYLMFIDDDDVPKRRAFHVIRQACQQNPGRMILFRIKRRGEVLWKTPEVVFGNVATPQFVVPNVPGRVGSWVTNDRYESDLDFISECVRLQCEPIWDRHVIAVADPFRWSAPAAWLEPRTRRWRNGAMIRTRMRTLLRRVGPRINADS
jgi:glycosyltransferase involved in cell wall biosynthesis